jgi:2-iminoacetate synthase ThiH
MTKSAASLEPLHDRSRLTAADAITLLEGADLLAMMEVAATLRDRGHASVVSFSKKVHPALPRLLPLLHVCSSAGARGTRLS